MVGKNRQNSQLINKVAEVYDWLNSQIKDHKDPAGECCACGKCCDFDGFDHKLFVTSPELIYFVANLDIVLTAETAESAEENKIKKNDNIKNLCVLCELSGKMKMSRCPYNVDGKCGIYEIRFSGCRIFTCKGDADFQGRLSEIVSKKFKAICEQFQIPYRYTDLATALNELAGDL